MDAGTGPEAWIPLLAPAVPQNESTQGARPETSSSLLNECTGQRRALLIGVSRSKAEGYDVLPNVHDDVYKMRDLLLEIYHYTPSQITILVDDGIEGHVQPTRANILDAIRKFVKDVKAGDRLCFYYSGHTTQVENRSNSEEDGLDECKFPYIRIGLIPLDGGIIVDNELHAVLVRPLPSGSHLVAVLDASNSGSLLDLPHYRCNRVFVPWIWRGKRNSEDLWNGVVRRNARFGSGPISNAGAAHVDNRPATRSSLARLRPKSRGTLFRLRTSLSTDKKDYDKTKKSLATEDVGPVAHALSKPHWFLPDEAARCDSPIGQWPCDGWCRNVEWRSTAMEEADEVKADVISLASCKDSQEAWELDGVSMTSSLVDLLREDPNRTLKDVLVRVSHAMCSIALMRHSRAKGYKKNRKRYIAHLLRNIRQLERGNRSTASLVSPPGIATPPTFPHVSEPRKLVQVVSERIASLWQNLNKVRQDKGYDMSHFQNPELASPRPLDMNRLWRM
ncbi:Metacaspase type II [Mycena sanguinolenta]|uniref:Metacaspase type II n=1 Tax=Mycena sanguinolenta TaxID=230812 RepID=A0A8H7CGN4_9AGAR|nr:Metacaspase type II [Mycena sanguinolenta]